MSKYKVVPTDIKTGSVAPYFVVDIADTEKIEKVADGLSPLFKSERWEAITTKLPSNSKKFNSKRN